MLKTRAKQDQPPVQPVNKPILCNPYEEPAEHWVYESTTGEPIRTSGRRPASYWYKDQRTGSAQLSLLAEESRDDLPLINALRDDVRRWRGTNYECATPVTKQLLAHWAREDRPRRLFFCQLEAVETVIYLNEILASGKRPRWTPKLSPDDYGRLCRGEAPSLTGGMIGNILPTLIDTPNEGGPPLTRYGCKMATGSGKTVVMAMLIAWSLCNRGQVPSDVRFPSAALVCCPNLTVKERLQVLRPEHPDNYYAAFGIVPTKYRPLLDAGRVLVANWQGFGEESPHAEGGKTYQVVNKGPESNEAYAKRILGDLAGRGPIMVFNDEGHHAYRPKPPETKEEAAEATAAKEENWEATIWIQGLDRINAAEGAGIKRCVDLSATPFYIAGSGHPEGAPFPWIVSDFGLVDAIESGIVKIPRLPVSDVTGRPEPKYFRLWGWINDQLKASDRLPGKAKKPKPEAVWREAEGALRTLASQWKAQFEAMQTLSPNQVRIPPVLIVVCDNTDIAEIFYRHIAGEEVISAIDGADEADDEDEEGEDASKAAKGKGAKTKVSYGHGRVFPEYFGNHAGPGGRRTLRIDSKLLAEAESEAGGSKQKAAEELRRIVATVGRPGEPGEHIRCVVSVGMLTEGWDANNVTHILGLRAFGSQLLSEQVVGRGLRRMDYTVDPETGQLSEEYVDVYGIPFSVIPFRGNPVDKPVPQPKPKQHVRALPERSAYEIRFPIVEGYAFALKRNIVRADIGGMDVLEIEPEWEPTAVFVKPQVGYSEGRVGAQGPGRFEYQNREEFYASTHLNQIAFEIARQVVGVLVGDYELPGGSQGKRSLRLQSRHQLFPQVLRLTLAYIDAKVRFKDEDPRELGLERYVRQVVDRLVAAIEPDASEGEPPLLPILNRYQRSGTTADVDFKTVTPCFPTVRSHLNLVQADTSSWEQSAAFRLEQATDVVAFYARNEGLDFAIPYDFGGGTHRYEPDFLVRMTDGTTLLLEIKGYEDNEDRAKYGAARRWVRAVNTWGEAGRWAFHVCKDPQMLAADLRRLFPVAKAAD